MNYNKKLILILSPSYSGSTYTGYVLGSLPKSAFVGESHRVITKVKNPIDKNPELPDLPTETDGNFGWSQLKRNVMVDYRWKSILTPEEMEVIIKSELMRKMYPLLVSNFIKNITEYNNK